MKKVSGKNLIFSLVIYVTGQEVVNFIKVTQLGNFIQTESLIFLKIIYCLVIVLSLTSLIQNANNIQTILHNHTITIPKATFVFFIFIITTGVLIGFQKNNVEYIFRDLIGYFTGPIVLLAFYIITFNEDPIDYTVQKLKQFYLPIYSTLLIYFLWSLINNNLRYPAMSSLGLLLVYIHSITNRKTRKSTFIMSMIVLSLKRSIIGVATFVLFISGVIDKSYRNTNLKIFTFIAVIITTIFMISITISKNGNLPYLLQERINASIGMIEPGQKTAGIHKDGRVLEVQNAIRSFDNSSKISLFFGSGLGFTYSSQETGTKEFRTERGIHVTPFNIFFKHGLIGLSFYIWIIIMLAQLLIRQIKHTLKSYQAAVYYILSFVVLSFFSANYVSDLLAWALIGIILKDDCAN